MIKLFIADDELLVLMGMRVIADWQAHGIEIVGEARDGKSALRLIMETAPDIVITDLNMPVLDGIELIKRLKQTGYQGQIIVLSNYNELQMVKEAIKAGAADYVLKVTLNGAELVELIRSLSGVSEQTADGTAQQGRNSLALDWLHGGIDVADLRSRIEQFRLRIGERNRLMVASVLRGEREAPDAETLRHMLLEVANRNAVAEVLTLGAGRCLLVFPVMAGDESESQLQEIGEDIRLLIQRYLNLDMLLLYQQQHVAWERMAEEVRYLAIGLDSEFYEPRPGVRRIEEVTVSLELDEAFWRLKRRLQDQLELGEEVSPLLAELFRHMEDRRYGIKALRQISRNLYALADEVVRSAGGELDVALDSSSADGLEGVEHFAAYCSRIEQLFRRVHAGITQLRSGRKRDEIRKAIAYIKLHYRSKITLEELSGHVNLNKNYFSTLFKQETELSPVEYIIHYKMERARELLLSGQATVSAVSQDLGYDDLSYFSRLFKKHFGVSPGAIVRKS